MLISYFMSILPHKMNLIEIKGFMSFFTNFTQPPFNNSGNIVDDIST